MRHSAPGSAPTGRELEVLVAVAVCDGKKGAAYRLGISQATVRFHIENVRRCADVLTTAGAVYYFRDRLPVMT